MKFCTLHLSRGHAGNWGATDSASNRFPPLTLFSDSFRVSQNLNHAQSISKPFFCLPLLFPLCTVPCKNILASPADLDTRPNQFILRSFTMVDKMLTKGPIAYMILSLTASMVVRYLHGLPTSAAHESDIWA